MSGAIKQLDVAALRRLAKSRLVEANYLLNKRKWEGAYYLCGYAVELALKASACSALNWNCWPPSGVGDRLRTALCTHKLEELLVVSGKETQIKQSAIFGDWSIVAGWSSEQRYVEIGNVKDQVAKEMIRATRSVLKFLGTI